MSTRIDILRVRKILGRDAWFPPQPYPEGWSLMSRTLGRSVIVTVGEREGVDWVHASVAGDDMPTYEHLHLLHEAVFGGGYAYLCFPPPDRHVNIHPYALHLFGRLDGERAMPEFSDVVDGVRSV